LPRVSVQDLLIHPRDNDLLIGTHGRGIFVLDHLRPLQEFKPEIADQPSHLFGIDDWTPVPRGSSSGFAGDRKRIAGSPQRGAAIWYHLKNDVDEKDVSLTVFNSEGKEVAKLKIQNKAGLHRVAFPSSSGGRRRGPGGFQRSSSTGPGKYKAVLKLGDQTQEKTFEIKAQ